MNLSGLSPGKVLVAGDWHGSKDWALSVIEAAHGWLPGEEKIILQLGDFGYGGGFYGSNYLMQLSDRASDLGVKLFFIDGNHEDHPLLASEEDEDGKVAESIWHLRRGTRWEWHGHRWLALGGAVSLDRSTRRLGSTWFREEEISLVTAGMVTMGGTADVMITHDCPSGVVHSFGTGYFDPKDIARCEWHRELLQGIVDEVRPSHLLHGHLHRGYVRDVRMRHGEVRVTGLDMDGEESSMGLLDTRTLEFILPEEVPE